MVTSVFELPVFGSEDAIDALPPLRDRYDFNCCACGSAQSAAHLLESEAPGVNGIVMCVRCSAILRVAVVGDTIVVERESIYRERMRRIQAEVLDGGF